MTQKKLFGTIALAVVAAVSFTSCNQSPKAEDEAPKSQAPSNLKIAYVEVDSLMTQYEYCKEYSLILEKKSQNIQSTLQQKGQALQAAANNFQQKLQQNAYTREQAEQIQMGLQKQNADLEALQQRLSAEFQEETAKFNDALHDSLQHFIAKYNKDKKFTMILSKSGDNILYADKSADITSDIIAGLNKAYKKGSASEKKDK
ncbi:MAG: OmpH family outer membrane protein [Prevotella sp.]|jgi:outer membrane protein|nr:OmpH family outer membrane protein [Prevotella sp.]MBP3750898.1 OmpH family outer membrane protein [Prevotella sp.]